MLHARTKFKPVNCARDGKLLVQGCKLLNRFEFNACFCCEILIKIQFICLLRIGENVIFGCPLNGNYKSTIFSEVAANKIGNIVDPKAGMICLSY